MSKTFVLYSIIIIYFIISFLVCFVFDNKDDSDKN